VSTKTSSSVYTTLYQLAWIMMHGSVIASWYHEIWKLKAYKFISTTIADGIDCSISYN
jgi:hypothetical protein